MVNFETGKVMRSLECSREEAGHELNIIGTRVRHRKQYNYTEDSSETETH